MIMIPVMLRFGTEPKGWYVTAILANTVIHAFVDDLKANRDRINLVTDQLIHLAQIAVTGTVFLLAL